MTIPYRAIDVTFELGSSCVLGCAEKCGTYQQTTHTKSLLTSSEHFLAAMKLFHFEYELVCDVGYVSFFDDDAAVLLLLPFAMRIAENQIVSMQRSEAHSIWSQPEYFPAGREYYVAMHSAHCTPTFCVCSVLRSSFAT